MSKVYLSMLQNKDNRSDQNDDMMEQEEQQKSEEDDFGLSNGD